MVLSQQTNETTLGDAEIGWLRQLRSRSLRPWALEGMSLTCGDDAHWRLFGRHVHPEVLVHRHTPHLRRNTFSLRRRHLSWSRKLLVDDRKSA
jgi:hypothetical protein